MKCTIVPVAKNDKIITAFCLPFKTALNVFYSYKLINTIFLFKWPLFKAVIIADPLEIMSPDNFGLIVKKVILTFCKIFGFLFCCLPVFYAEWRIGLRRTDRQRSLK